MRLLFFNVFQIKYNLVLRTNNVNLKTKKLPLRLYNGFMGFKSLKPLNKIIFFAIFSR